MAKSSFSLLETILAIAILSLLLGGFTQFTYSSSDETTSISDTSNLLKQNQNTRYINKTYEPLSSFSSEIILKNNNQIEKIVYEDETIKLERYRLLNPTSQNIESKLVE